MLDTQSLHDVATAFDALSSRKSQTLTEARIALHWAAQIPAAVGSGLAEPKEDFSHTALGWNPSVSALVGTEVDGKRAALWPALARVGVLDAAGRVLDQFHLEQKNLQAGLAWMAQLFGVDTLDLPNYDMPDSALSGGVPFESSWIDSWGWLEQWYAASHGLLGEVARQCPQSSAVRCWPHHFDMATLIAFDLEQPDQEQARSIGVGFSPGDVHYAQPYFYIMPWPHPDVALLPSLVHGYWHTENFVSAVLLVEDVFSEMRLSNTEQIVSFIDEGINACSRLLKV